MIPAACVALAAAAAPLAEPEKPPATAAEREAQVVAWLDQALPQLTECQDSAAFLTALGRLLMAQGRMEEAAEHLERALLLEPTHKPALAAFGLVLANLGDLQAARQLLAPLRSPPQSQSRLSGSWGLTGGFERNLLGAPSLSSLTLTYPGLEPGQAVLITLPLDNAVQPKAGSYAQASGQLQWRHASHTPLAWFGPRSSEWVATVGLRQREVPSLRQAGFSMGEASLQQASFYGVADAPLWGHHLHLDTAALNSRTGVRFLTTSMGAGLALAAGSCQLRWSLEAQRKAYPSNPVLDGQFRGHAAQAGCEAWPALNYRQGSDTPQDANRPGGPQAQQELRLSWQWRQWSLDAEASRVRDATGYSPLIEQGATRQQLRQLLRIEHSLPISALEGQSEPQPQLQGLHWVLGVEASKQKSNLSLFQSNNLGVFFAVRLRK